MPLQEGQSVDKPTPPEGGDIPIQKNSNVSIHANGD
jgi:hypothetical protein